MYSILTDNNLGLLSIWVYNIYLCLFGFIWVYLGLIFVYLGLFGLIWVYLGLFDNLRLFGFISVPLINEFVPSGFNPGSCMYICVSVWIYIYIYD